MPWQLPCDGYAGSRGTLSLCQPHGMAGAFDGAKSKNTRLRVPNKDLTSTQHRSHVQHVPLLCWKAQYRTFC